MRKATAASRRLQPVRHLRNGVFLVVVLFTFLAWTLQVALMSVEPSRTSRSRAS